MQLLISLSRHQGAILTKGGTNSVLGLWVSMGMIIISPQKSYGQIKQHLFTAAFSNHTAMQLGLSLL